MNSIDLLVGQIVWYVPGDHEIIKMPKAGTHMDTVCAAIITKVHDNYSVNVMIFGPDGCSEHRESVLFIQPTEKSVNIPYCCLKPKDNG